MGRLGAVLEAYCAVLDNREAEKAKKPQSLKNQREINDFSLSGLSSDASWGSLGPSWRPLGPSWGRLGSLGAIFGRQLALLGSLGGLFGPS